MIHHLSCSSKESGSDGCFVNIASMLRGSVGPGQLHGADIDKSLEVRDAGDNRLGKGSCLHGLLGDISKVPGWHLLDFMDLWSNPSGLLLWTYDEAGKSIWNSTNIVFCLQWELGWYLA